MAASSVSPEMDFSD